MKCQKQSPSPNPKLANTLPIQAIVEHCDLRLLHFPEIKALTGWSKSTLWRRERAANDPFPSRIRLSPRTLAWNAEAVYAWIASRPRGMAGQ